MGASCLGLANESNGSDGSGRTRTSPELEVEGEGEGGKSASRSDRSCDLQGEFTIVQVDIQQLYVICAKKYPINGISCILKNSKIEPISPC